MPPNESPGTDFFIYVTFIIHARRWIGIEIHNFDHSTCSSAWELFSSTDTLRGGLPKCRPTGQDY